MAEEIQLSIDLEGAGWLTATLACDEQLHDAQASYFSEALLDVVDALLALWFGAAEGIAVWWEEPQAERPYEYKHWRFVRGDDAVTVELRGDHSGYGYTSDADLIFSTELPLDVLSEVLEEAVRQAVTDLTDDEYRAAWTDRSDRQQLLVRLTQLRDARLGDAPAEALARLCVARPGMGGYWSDLAPPISK